jgi:hypothetical protein
MGQNIYMKLLPVYHRHPCIVVDTVHAPRADTVKKINTENSKLKILYMCIRGTAH